MLEKNNINKLRKIFLNQFKSIQGIQMDFFGEVMSSIFYSLNFGRNETDRGCYIRLYQGYRK